MSNRHLSRSVALQSLFEWDFRGCVDTEIEEIVHKNLDEFAPGMHEVAFVFTLVKRVLEHKSTIDGIIEKAAPDWPLPQISPVDRNVLRLGLSELLFSDKKEVPAKVAINEAIELAKTFGGETSGRFVNGVLGTVYKEMGEPGKDEVSKKKKPREQLDPSTFPVELKGGAVVYAIEDGEIFLGFVHDIFGYWTLSKGSIEEGEDAKTGARREVQEEIGIDVEIQDVLGENEYIASHPEKGKIRKHVVYYLARCSPKTELKLEVSGGLDDARWFSLTELPDLQMYDDILPIVTKAIKLISEKKG